MRGGLKGIYNYGDRFKVQLTRQGTTYSVGIFETYEEAVYARAAFLDEFKINSNPAKYTKLWWDKQAKEQTEKFKTLELEYKEKV